MNIRKKAVCAFTFSHSDEKYYKKRKIINFNLKSCTAMFLAVTLLFTAIEGIQVRAEESTEQVPGVEDTDNSVDIELSYVKTSDGAVIISSFEPLSKEASHIELEERINLEELVNSMPKTLTAYAEAYMTDEAGSDGDQSGKEEDDETEGEEGVETDDEVGNKSEDKKDGETDEEESDEIGDEEVVENDSEESGETGGEEVVETDEEEDDEAEGEEIVETGSEESGETGSEEVDETDEDDGMQSDNNGELQSEADDVAAVQDGHQWHLLVAADDPVENEEQANEGDDEMEDATDEDDDQSGEDVGNGDDQPDGGDTDADDGAGSEGSGTEEDGAGDDTDTGEEKVVSTIQSVDVEIPVQWVCEEDYENTELTEYTFRPTWDSAAWFYEAGTDADSVPTITVSYTGEVIAEEVSTEEELAAAFAAGLKKITLKADIALTRTLWLPATADIELDGQGYSLLRGKNENDFFIGTMISMDGEDYTEETYGTLTLKDITVNGQTPADRAGAPVILDCGSLILEKDAAVRDNYNYGTYPSGGENAETILDYGGGIQVYGKLSVTEESLITGNFADELGGGVYLADGATLYLYADMIRGNIVSAGTGYGADLYAAPGCTIYYDSSIDMERDGFYLCKGVILICMQGQNAMKAANMSDRNDDKVEIFISTAEESGYDNSFVAELTKKLEDDYGYSVIPKMAQVDTSDLRNWYVYDHYDTACWGDETEIDANGNTVPKQWRSTYGDNPKRKYYPCMESYYNRPTTPVYTIADWLNSEGYQYGSGRSLAQFKEHIYSRSSDMTFVGYGSPGYIDFMFYDPQSNGEKVVDFDIDSSLVISHALSGMGFLVNTGVEDGKLHGYLVFYYYDRSELTPGDKPTMLYVFKLDGVDIEKFHGGECDIKYIFKQSQSLSEKGITIIGNGVPIDSSKWNSQMSIRMQVSPTKIEIWQQAKDSTADLSETLLVSQDVQDSGYSGFGPLMAYTSYGHGCSVASCFTYSNIHMYYTNPTQGKQDMLQPLEMADYTQEGTQKYFVNLFGESDQGYNAGDVETEIYRDYLKLMQVEGVALITDRDTTFEDYLGESGEAGSNLYEIDEKSLAVDTLAAMIAEYIKKQTTTYIQDKLSDEPGEDGKLKKADPRQAVGNIWIESASDGAQIRDALQGDNFTGDGYTIQIRDDITYFYEGRDKYEVTYEVIKPNGDRHTFKRQASDSTVFSFVVGTDPSDWPAGRYTVMQTIKDSDVESNVHGYAYFDLERSVVDSHTHIWGEYMTEKEPDCTTEGLKTRSCSVCGKTEEVTIPANEHSLKAEWSMNKIEHWHECEICNKKFDVDLHRFGEWITDEEATEGKDGLRHRSCTDCGYIEYDSIVRGEIDEQEERGENAPQSEVSNSEQAEIDYIVEINYQDQKEAVPESQKEAVPESQKDSEPKTGQHSYVELYATIAFIEGAAYLLFLFADRHGMTKETKSELVSRLIRWAQKGGKFRRWLALAAIFLLLVYFHSIGKQVNVEWPQVCGE